MITCFITKVNNIFNIKMISSKVVRPRRSTVTEASPSVRVPDLNIDIF
jgi:hypothetical protein